MGIWPKHLYSNKLAKTNRPRLPKERQSATQKSDGGTGNAAFPTDSVPPTGVTKPAHSVRSSHRLSLGRIKTFASTGHRHEEVARRKAWREARAEVLQGIDNFRHSDGVNPTEGSATKWRKPDSKHCANVAVAS